MKTDTHVSELSRLETLLQELLVLNSDQKLPWEVVLQAGADPIRIPNLPEFY